jgi:hypothetical protein
MPHLGDPEWSRLGEPSSVVTRRALLRGAAAAGSLPLLAGLGATVAAGPASFDHMMGGMVGYYDVSS